MSENHIPSLTGLADTIQKEAAPFRALHTKKMAEYDRLCEEFQYVHKAPTDRQALEEFILEVVDKYCAAFDYDFMGRLRAQVSGPDSTKGIDDSDALSSRWLNGLRSGLEPPFWLLVPLLRDSLRAGARRIAEEIDWPETDVETKTRSQRLQELAEKQAALNAEIEAIRAELAKVGVDPTVPS